MFVASNLILASLDSDKRDAAGELIFPTLDNAEKAIIRRILKELSGTEKHRVFVDM